MRRTAFIFAGQGSQYTGMGKEFYENYPHFREVFDEANLDFDLKEMCFSNPCNKLYETQFAQPCMVAYAIGITKILMSKGIEPDIVCGLSLGEYSALAAADVWSISDTLEIVSYRGNVMMDASKGIDYSMVAITGLGLEKIKDYCDRASEVGIVSICNINCPEQIVIGGEKKATAEAVRLSKDAGARRCVPLPVSGPFHTAFMEPAAERLGNFFRRIIFNIPTRTVFYNYLGGPNSTGTEISELLVQQVKNTVLFQNCIENMFVNGVDTFIEIGPGSSLSKFVKKTARHNEITEDQYRLFSTETSEDIERLASELI